jgi:L-iditol 2-dehydrogenase
MKALLLSEYNRLEMVDLPMPRPAAGELLIRVEACGICGSDVHGMDGSTGRRIPPIVMGHEAAGTVAAVGPGVTRFHEGDRVTFDSTVYCGECQYCRRGQVNLCDRREVLGVSTPDYRRAGAFAEYVIVPSHITYALPDNLSFTKAAMIEPLAVAMHAVDLSGIAKGDGALVVGVGMIGLLVAQVLRVNGCSPIYAVDIDERRLQLARELAGVIPLNAKTVDPGAELSRLTEKAGMPFAFEAVGATATIKTAIESTAKGGTVVLIGNVSPQVELPLQVVVSRQIRLLGSAASSGEYPQCIELLAERKVNVDPLISVVAPLVEGADWFQRLHAREPNLTKVILEPSASAEAAV